MVKQAWRGLTRPLRLIRFAEVRLWLVLAVVVSAFVFLFVLALARYRVFRRQMNLLKNMPKDSGRYIASGISKVLAVLRNPMDPAVVMYEGFNGYAQLTSQEGIFHFWIGMQPFVVLHAAHTIEVPYFQQIPRKLPRAIGAIYLQELVVIPAKVQNLLSLGPKFALKPKLSAPELSLHVHYVACLPTKYEQP
nr:uncharacterized protein LOC119162054 [Rhipicephalus microplus]